MPRRRSWRSGRRPLRYPSLPRQQLIDARENAAQDVDLLLLQRGAREQPPQPRHQPLRHPRIEEAHRGERRRAMRVQRLDLVHGRGLEPRRAPDLAAAGGETKLVRDDLHGRREIERRVVGVGGNRGDDAATRELGVGEARHLGAEHERDVAVRRVSRPLRPPPRGRQARAPRTRAAAPTNPPRRRSPRAPHRASRPPVRRRARPWRPTRARRPPDRDGVSG